MYDYPLIFDLDRPPTMARAHVFLRILLLALTSWVTGSSTQFGLAYLVPPVVAAVFIAQEGGERYLSEDGPRVTAWLSFIVALFAYLALLTDELPASGRRPIRFDVVRSAAPSVGSALFRIVKAIPSAFVLVAIGLVGWVVWVIAAISILVTEHYPERLWRFQRGVVRWQARLLGYLASLFDQYPPYSLDTGPAPLSA